MKKVLFFHFLIKALIIGLAILVCGSAKGQIENWQGLTSEELSDITVGTTNIASKSYWTSNAYAQIRDLYDMITASAVTVNDTIPDIGDAVIYYTANTTATEIDSLAFSGDYYKHILIYVGDDSTTFTEDGNIDCGGVSLAPLTGDWLEGFYNGTSWDIKFSVIE
uniref:Uncharacterized protein n=1 Tax=viral metagenome TaxID=1070528 RepID=A0A6M3L254_9ZZZZ